MCGLEALQRNTTRGLLIVQGNPSKLFLQSSKKHDDIRGLSDGVLCFIGQDSYGDWLHNNTAAGKWKTTFLYGAVFEPLVEHESQMYVFHTLLKKYIYKIHLFYLHRM